MSFTTFGAHNVVTMCSEDYATYGKLFRNAPKKDKTDRKARNFRSRGARIDAYKAKLKVGR